MVNNSINTNKTITLNHWTHKYTITYVFENPGARLGQAQEWCRVKQLCINWFLITNMSVFYRWCEQQLSLVSNREQYSEQSSQMDRELVYNWSLGETWISTNQLKRDMDINQSA
jgi:hypothetical protein